MGSRDATLSEVEGLDKLSSQLRHELKSIEAQFEVSREKLREISRQFERELKDGLEKDGTNIVCTPADAICCHY